MHVPACAASTISRWWTTGFMNTLSVLFLRQAFERFGDPSIPVEEAAEKLMRAGQSNAVKKEVAGKDTLPTDGVKGSGVTANSMASAVQARLRQKALRPPVIGYVRRARGRRLPGQRFLG